MGWKQYYAPPSFPPPRKPLLKASSALHYTLDLEELASQGWTTLPISDSPSDPLHAPFSDLFDASSRFFNLPEDERAKYRVAPKGDFQVSEEGYSRVEGEKCMIALRKARTTPTEFGLREKAEKAWSVSGNVMRDVLKAIEESLGMEEGALVRTTERQLELPAEGETNVATLMRMFRYDRPRPLPPSNSESSSNTPANAIANTTSAAAEAQPESRVVSEPHKDLGLLTIVIGHSPGLECWDAQHSTWVSCEPKEGLNATILVGVTLAKFTNGRFVPGTHRVFVHPASGPSPSSRIEGANIPAETPLFDPSYRFSLVHALRGHLRCIVSYTDFETPITGTFPAPLRFTDASISDIYHAISSAHWNVNISVEERRRQEREIEERAKREYSSLKKGSGRRISRIMSVFRRSTRQPTSVS